MIEGLPCGVNILLISYVVLLLVSLPVALTIAIMKRHVDPWFPAISDAATQSPESNIFSQLLNMSSCLGALLVYVRYLQVKRDVRMFDGNRTVILLNCWGLAFGLLTMASSSLVANFPETQVPVVHAVSSISLFIFANLYAWAQTLISFNMKRLQLIGSCVCAVRLMLSLVTSLAFVVALALTIYGMHKWSGYRLHWSSDNPAYKEHVIADAFEWLIVFCYLVMYLTLTKEFCHKKLQIKLFTGEKHDL